jgi:hypothetical protein
MRTRPGESPTFTITISRKEGDELYTVLGRPIYTEDHTEIPVAVWILDLKSELFQWLHG